MTPKIYLGAAVLAAAVAGGMWAGYDYGRAEGVREGAAIAQAEQRLTESGWTEGTTGKREQPEMPADLPDAAVPEAVIRTVVEYRDRPVPVEVERVVEVPTGIECADPWELTPNDLALDVRTDIVRVDGKPFGISSGVILARTPDGEVRRPFRTQEHLAALDLWAREARPEARRIAVGLRQPKHWRAGWTVGAAVLYAPDGSLHVGPAAVWGVQF